MSAQVRRLWICVGWLSIASVVVMFAGAPAYTASLAGTGDSPGQVTAALVTSSMPKGFAGGYLELVATLVFLAGALLAARLLRGDTELEGWLSSCMAGAAVTYTAVLAAVGAAAASALYGGHHGASLDVIATVSDISSFGFSVSGAAAGLYVLAASAAVHSTRLLPRWFAFAGYVVGLAGVAAVPLVRAGAPQMMLVYAWLVVFGVLALRRARQSAPVPAATATGFRD